MDKRTKLALLAVSLLVTSALVAYIGFQLAPLDPLAQFRTADGHLTIPGGKLTADLQRLLFPPPSPKSYWTYQSQQSAYPTLSIIGIEHAVEKVAKPAGFKPVGTDSYKVFFNALLWLPKDIISFFMGTAAAADGVCGVGATDNCYWVGGTGNFSDITHWASTSGGAGGLTPLSTSPVIFDAASGAGTATQNNATFTSAAVTMTNSSVTISGSSNTWKVGGSWSDANNHWSMSTSTVEFTATGTLTSPDTNGGDYFYNLTVSAGTISLAIGGGGNHITGVSRAFTVSGGAFQDDGSGTGRTVIFHNNGGSTTFFTYSGGAISATAVGRLTLEFDNSGGVSPNISFPGGTYTNVTIVFESRFGTNATFTLQGNLTTNIMSLGFDGPVVVDTNTRNVTLAGQLSATGSTAHHLISTSGTWATGGLETAGNTNWYWTAGSISVTDTGGCGGGCSYRNGSANNSWDGSSATYTYTGSTGGVWRPGSFTTAIEWGTLIMDTGGAYTLTMENNGMRVGALTVRNTHATTTNLDTASGSNFSITATSVTVGAGGTITARASTITVSGNWDSNAGTFTYGTSTIVFAASGTFDPCVGSGQACVNNLTINSSVTTTGVVHRWGFAGTFTINGTFAGSTFVDVRGSQTTPFVFGGSASYTGTGLISWLTESTITVSIPARTDWPNWRIQPLASSVILSVGGTSTVGNIDVICGGGSAELQTNANTFTFAGWQTTTNGACGMFFGVGASTVTDTSDTSFSAGTYWKLGGATITVQGLWTNASTSASWSTGTGQVKFTRVSGGTMTFAGTNLSTDEFFDVTFTSSSASTQTFTMATRGIKWSDFLSVTDSSGATVLSTAGLALTGGASSGMQVSGTAANNISLGASAVTVGSSGVLIQATDYLVGGTSSWTVTGNWQNISTSASWSTGSMAVTFTSILDQTMRFAGTNLSTAEFANVTFQSAAGSAKTFTMADRGLRLSGTLLINDGTSTTTLDTSASNLPVTAGVVTVGVNGILNGRASTLTVNGNWNSTDGTFTYGTSTVVFAATGTAAFTGTASTGFYNLTVNLGVTVSPGVGSTTLWRTGGIVTVNGTLTGASQILQLDGNGPFGSPNQVLVMGGSGSVSGLSTVRFKDIVSDHMSIPGTTYPALELTPATGSTHTTTLLGNMSASSLLIQQTTASSSIDEILTTSGSNYSITVSGALTVATASNQKGTLTVNGSSVTLGSLTLNTGGTLNGNTGTITVNGNWNSAPSGGSFVEGTSTVVLNATSVFSVSSDNNERFYNLTVSAGATITNAGAGGGSVEVGRVLTVNGSLNDGAFHNTFLTAALATPFVLGGAGSVASANIIYRPSVDYNVVGTAYRTVSIQDSAVSGTIVATMMGNVSSTSTQGIGIGSDGTNAVDVLSTNGFTLTFVSLSFLGSDGELLMNGIVVQKMQMSTNSGNIVLTSWAAYFSDSDNNVRWTFNPSGSSATVEVVLDGLTPMSPFDMKRDGAIVAGAIYSDASGELIFDVTGGWSSHDMLVSHTLVGGGAGGTPPPPPPPASTPPPTDNLIPGAPIPTSPLWLTIYVFLVGAAFVTIGIAWKSSVRLKPKFKFIGLVLMIIAGSVLFIFYVL